MIVKIIFGVVAIDLLSKFFARAKLHTIDNSGLTFSLPASPEVSLIMTALIFAVLFFYYYFQKNSFTPAQNLGMGFILGGALANLLERIYSGHVTDFIKIGAGYLNVADLAIIAGVILLLLSLIKFKPQISKFEN